MTTAKGGALTPRQRAHLKALAHPLKPILQVGKGGVDDDVARSLADAFQNRELLKVKVLEAAPVSARQAADEITARLPAVRVVQVIGRTIVAYRQHPERPEIKL